MKKFLSLLLSFMLIFAVIPTFQASAANEPTFVISSAKGKVGDIVKITISTKNNPGVISMQVCVNYDQNALKLIDYNEGDFKGVSYGPETKIPFIATWIDPLSPNNDTNGVLVTLEFEVLDTAPNGKSEISLTYDPENVFEYNTSAKDNFKNVHFEVESGYVDIKNPNPKKPSSSQVSSSNTASVDEETNQVYEQIIDELLSSAQSAPEIIVDKETTSSNNTASKDNANANVEGEKNNSADSQNGWIIWVVVAAILLLGAAFATVIFKGKKSKH